LNRIVSTIFRLALEDIRSTFFGKQTTSTVRRRQYTDTHGERKNTGKLTIAATSKCRICFYSVRSGKKTCGVLQKLLMSQVQLRVHTDTQQQQAPPPGRTPTFPCDGGAANAGTATSGFIV
jgi:hypothetical protein